MPEFSHSRDDVQALFDRWIADNKKCEAERSWSRLADYYADPDRKVLPVRSIALHLLVPGGALHLTERSDAHFA